MLAERLIAIMRFFSAFMNCLLAVRGRRSPPPPPPLCSRIQTSESRGFLNKGVPVRVVPTHALKEYTLFFSERHTQFKYEKALVTCFMHNHEGPPTGMQQNTKLSHPLFSEINANSATCQMESVLPGLPNKCFCVRSEPHATQLPAGSNTHYPCGIIPPSDRPQLSAQCFPRCSARVSLFSFLFPVRSLTFACGGVCGILLLLPGVCVRVTGGLSLSLHVHAPSSPSCSVLSSNVRVMCY